MAKATAAQLEAYKAKGFPEARIESIPQASFDRMFPPAAPPAPAAPAARQPIPAIKTSPSIPASPVAIPVATTPATAPIRTTPPIPTADDLKRNVPAVKDLPLLRDEFIASRSRDPLGLVVPEREKEAQSQAEAIINQPFTLGGVADPFLSSLAAPPTKDPADITMAEALSPQTILTLEQKRAKDAIQFQASQAALVLEQNRLDEILRNAAIAKAPEDTIRQLQKDRMNIDGSANYIKTKKEIEELLYSGGQLKDYKPSAPVAIGESTEVVVRDTAERALEQAFGSPGFGGKIVESPAAYTGRLLAAPVSSGVGLVEGIITDKTVYEAAATRIAEGRAAMGAGYDIGKAASDYAELPESDPFRTAAQYVGGGAGLIIDFLIPVVPGYGAAKAGVQAGVKAATASKALSLAPKMSVTRAVTRAVARGAARSIVEDIPIISKLSPRLADDVYSGSIARFGDDLGNQAQMKEILKVSAEMDEADAIKGLAKEATDNNTKLIEEAMRKAGNNSDPVEFMATARRLGFDLEDAATHARIKGDLNINIRKAVLDDGLSADSKLRLSESKAQLTDKDLAELYIFMKKRGGAGIVPPSVLQKPTAEAIKGIREGLARAKIGNVKKAFEVIDNAGIDSVARHYLYTQGANILTDVFVKTPGIGAPDVVRLTRSSFAPKDKVQEIIRKVSADPINTKIRPRLISAINRGEASITLTDDELDLLVQTFGSESIKGRAVDAASKQAAREISDLLPKDRNGKSVLTAKKYNELVEKLTDDVAASVPGSKTVFEVSDDLARIEEGAAGSISKKIYYNKVLTPKEVAGGSLESVVSTGVKKALDEAEPFGTVMSREFVDTIGQKWGSINEDFKAVYRSNRALGLSAPDAWSKTMVENYTKHSETLIKEAEVIFDADAVKNIKIQNFNQMYDDYVAMLYGGYESMIDAINTTGRTQFIDGMLVPPFEMRKLAYILGETPMVKSLKQRFVQRALTSDFGEALVELRNVHAILQGKGMKSLIKSEDELKKFWEAAVASDKNNVLGYLPFKTEGYQQGTRGAFEIWNYAGETAPMFTVDDHLKLLASQYLVRKQSAIVSQTYSEWSRIYPELFPTAANIAKRAEQYGEIIKSYPESLYKAWSDNMLNELIPNKKNLTIYEEVVDPVTGVVRLDSFGNPVTKAVKPEQIPKVADYSNRLEKLYKDKGDAFNYFDSQIVAEWTGSTEKIDIASYAMQDVMAYVSKDPANLRKMYVALVEDSLTRMSASEETATSFSSLLRTLKKQTIESIRKDADAVIPDVVDNLLLGNIPTTYSSKFEEAIYKFGKAQRDYILNQPASGTFGRQLTQQEFETLFRGGDLNIFAEHADAFLRHYEIMLDDIYRYMFFEGKQVQVHRQLSGVNDYITSIYPMLRAETTPLFYDTLKTAVRNAAKSNIEVITKGPIEQVSTIPLTFKESAAAKKSLLNRSGIEAFTDSMEELRITSTARKVPDMPNASTLDEAIKAGLEVTGQIKAASNKSKGYARFINVITDVIGSPSAGFSDGRIARFVKGGVLGGQLLPGIRYLGTNYMTAPAIIYSTLGPKYARGALKQAMLLDTDVNSVMKILLGTDLYAPVAPIGLLDIVHNGSKEATRIVVKSPTGKVYTNYDIAQIVQANSIARSQASAELSQQILDDLVSWSGINKDKLLGNGLDSFGKIGKNQVAEAIKKSYASTGGRAMNAFQELGQMTDTMFRTKVLKEALASGVSEPEAIVLAREALFDYGNLTAVEKTIVNKIFWFWTFRRNSYRNVMKSFLTNPARMKNSYLANGYIEEMGDRKEDLASREYTETRPFIYLVDDKVSKQRFGLYGPGIPQLQATAELIDYIAYFPMLIADNKRSAAEKIMSIPKDLVFGYAAQATPMPQTIIGLSFGVDPRREGKDLGYGIDPRMMWYLQRNPAVWSAFQALVNVEVVPPDSEIPGAGTYQGRQWRIRKGDEDSVRAWFAMQQALLMVGVQRNMRDYAPLFEVILGEQEGALPSDVTSIQLGGEGENKDLINLLYMTGVITPVTTPTLQDQIEFNRRVIAAEFREGTYKKPEN